MTLDVWHLLDWSCGPDWQAQLDAAVTAGQDLSTPHPATGETALHVAARRRRVEVVRHLVELGVMIDTRDGGGKTALVASKRRGFEDVAAVLVAAGAHFDPTPADELAIALSTLDLDEARRVLAAFPNAACTGNPAEDRLLADVAGRAEAEPVELLLSAGAPLDVPGMDDGTPLHQAAWFGQPHQVRRLIEAGAPLDIFDRCHQSSPLHWAIHGAEFSDGAGTLGHAYAAIVRSLLEAGCSTDYPPHLAGAGTYRARLFENPPPEVRAVLVEFLGEPDA